MPNEIATGRGDVPSPSSTDVPRALTPAAQRALAEAAERRNAMAAAAEPKELNGRGGKDPVRFGDWEIKGRAVDF